MDGPEQHTRAFWVSQEALKPIVVRPPLARLPGPHPVPPPPAPPHLCHGLPQEQPHLRGLHHPLQGTGGSAELKFSEPRYGASPAPIEQLVFDITTVQLIACNPDRDRPQPSPSS
mgnify:CR=1 FL=1